MGKLNETLDLITLYKHHVGEREVPSAYDEWACISLIAACVGNRVWFEKFQGAKLVPNLYVMLVGPSANGKGIAIDDATLPYIAHVPMVNMYRGKATGPFIVEYLGSVQKGGWGVKNSCLYLVTPELSLSVGNGPNAEEFIKLMTELYTGGAYTYQHGTRTRGNVKVSGHTLNWFGASTENWFVSALSKEDVEGGVMGRIAVIVEPYQDVCIPEPKRSLDYYELREHIQARIYNLLGVSGQFAMTERARELHNQWYHERRKENMPSEESGLMPTWKRMDDLVLKLSMVQALSSGRTGLQITGDDFTQAEKWSYRALEAVPRMIALASTTKESEGLQYVRDVIRKTELIQRQMLIRKVAKRGILAVRLQELVNQLEQEGSIETSYANKSTWYTWKKRGLK